MGALKNYILGKLGVVIDKSPVHNELGELRKAQNAIRDPLGVDGGVKNRPGLVKFNSVAAAGSLLGGIAVPQAGLIDATTLYIAKKDGTDENWYQSSDLFANSSQNSNIAAWQDPSDVAALLANVAHSGAFWNGQLYYAGADYTIGTTSPVVRVFNGIDDRELCKILPATTRGVASFIVDKGYLYVLTLDSGSSDADWVGRVFRLAANGHFTQIGNALSTGYIPTALCVYNNVVFVAGSKATVTSEAQIFRCNPLDETSWTTDATLDADDHLVTAMKVFRGEIYLTTKNGGAGTKGKIKKRTIAGVYSTVDSTVANSGQYDGLEIFGSHLYASSRVYDSGTSTAVIRRSSDGASWATVYNSASTAGVGHLVTLGLRIFSYFGTGLLHSSNGTSYTSATPGGNGNANGVLGAALIRKAGQEFSEPAASSSGSTTVQVTNVDNRTTSQKVIHWIANLATSVAGSGTVSGTSSNVSATLTKDTLGNWAVATSAVSGTQCTLRIQSGVGRIQEDFTVTIVVRTGSDLTSSRIWVGLSASSGSFADNDTQAASDSLAFRYSTVAGDAGWKATANNGASQTVGSGSAAIAVSTVYVLKIVVSGDGTSAAFYVNGTLVDTLTTNFPDTSTDLFAMATIIPQAASSRQLEIRTIAVAQEFDLEPAS